MNRKKADEIHVFPNLPSPTRPVVFNPSNCTGCNKCVNVCIMDILIPNPEKGKPPLVVFPDECWYDACCELHCPESDAIRLNYPLMWKVPWKRKETGEYHWVGERKPLPPNPRPPA